MKFPPKYISEMSHKMCLNIGVMHKPIDIVCGLAVSVYTTGRCAGDRAIDEAAPRLWNT